MDAGVTVRVPLVVLPVPVRVTLTVGSEALEVRASVALYGPDVVGEKVIDRLVLPPGERVYGKPRPLKVKPVPVMEALEIVRLDPPVFEMVRVWVWLLPTLMVPKLKLPGALKKPPATPVPTRFAVMLPL